LLKGGFLHPRDSSDMPPASRSSQQNQPSFGEFST
jgi:hypothetical protein